MTRPTLRAVLLAGCLAFACASQAQEEPTRPPEREGLRIDDRRPEQPTTIEVFGRQVQLTGSWEYTDEWRGNFDLDEGRARNRREHEHEIELEARTRPTADSELFLQAVGVHETRRTQNTRGHQRDAALERGQAWLRLERLGATPWALQAGRVALIDRRSWWWDDDLDMVRALGTGKRWSIDTGLARQLARLSPSEREIDPTVRGVTRWFGQATWRPARRHRLDAFWLVARDGSGRPAAGTTRIDEDALDPSDLRASWFGVRASGEWRFDSNARIGYWADTALLRGRESVTDFVPEDDDRFTAAGTASRRVRGWAVDLGATVVVPIALRPSISAGYARGSGGRRDASRDDNFRQTGLQENKQRLGGVKRLQLYGELLQPELSNLSVSTLAAGVRILDNSSIEVVAHRYRQPAPSTLLFSRLDADPQGLLGDIGSELDLVIVFRESRRLEIALRLSRFTPGAAFAAERRDRAYSVELGFEVNF